MSSGERSGPRVPGFARPLIALAVLMVGWVVYISYLVVDGDRDPASWQLLAVRIVAGLSFLAAVALFVRDRRTGSGT